MVSDHYHPQIPSLGTLNGVWVVFSVHLKRLHSISTNHSASLVNTLAVEHSGTHHATPWLCKVINFMEADLFDICQKPLPPHLQPGWKSPWLICCIERYEKQWHWSMEEAVRHLDQVSEWRVVNGRQTWRRNPMFYVCSPQKSNN